MVAPRNMCVNHEVFEESFTIWRVNFSFTNPLRRGLDSAKKGAGSFGVRRAP